MTTSATETVTDAEALELIESGEFFETAVWVPAQKTGEREQR